MSEGTDSAPRGRVQGDRHGEIWAGLYRFLNQRIQTFKEGRSNRTETPTGTRYSVSDLPEGFGVCRRPWGDGVCVRQGPEARRQS